MLRIRRLRPGVLRLARGIVDWSGYALAKVGLRNSTYLSRRAVTVRSYTSVIAEQMSEVGHFLPKSDVRPMSDHLPITDTRRGAVNRRNGPILLKKSAVAEVDIR
jgi:hypothetical protein